MLNVLTAFLCNTFCNTFSSRIFSTYIIAKKDNIYFQNYTHVNDYCVT